MTEIVSDFWSQYDLFTDYLGVKKDKFDPNASAANVTYHVVKHASEQRKIWFRTNDTVIVYEEYEDGGATRSWVKWFDGGIKEDRWLYLTSFKIPRCPNDLKATH